MNDPTTRPLVIALGINRGRPAASLSPDAQRRLSERLAHIEAHAIRLTNVEAL